MIPDPCVSQVGLSNSSTATDAPTVPVTVPFSTVVVPDWGELVGSTGWATSGEAGGALSPPSALSWIEFAVTRLPELLISTPVPELSATVLSGPITFPVPLSMRMPSLFPSPVVPSESVPAKLPATVVSSEVM